MVTHERNALPRFMMANWCWYTPNVALINIGRERRTRAAKLVYIIVNEKKQLPLLKVRRRLTEVCLQTAANSAHGGSRPAHSSPPTQRVLGGTSTCSQLELVWHSLRAPNKLVKKKQFDLPPIPSKIQAGIGDTNPIQILCANTCCI